MKETKENITPYRRKRSRAKRRRYLTETARYLAIFVYILFLGGSLYGLRLLDLRSRISAEPW